MKRIFTHALAIGLVFMGNSLTPFARGQSAEEQAKKLLENHSQSLVVVSVKKAKLNSTTTGEPITQDLLPRLTLGVTVADNGLIVVSNSSIDSSVGLVGQKAQIRGDKVVTIRTAKCEFEDIELSYGSSVTIHGNVVMQDVDADIAFILPDQAEAKAVKVKFNKVDFSKFNASADVTEEVIGLSRASSSWGFTPIVNLGRITGKIKTPRPYFLTTVSFSQGMPVFTKDGRVLGLVVTRIVGGKPTGGLGVLSGGSIQVMANIASDRL